LQKRLDKVEVQRNQARRARQRNAVPVVALVGYTNAGKSTLFNALTGSQVYAANQLFATLDPTVRRLEGLESGPVVLADTVGFIRDLPHDLVAAFRSTLAEARDADLLLHVVDASDPERDDRMADVDTVLREIGAGDLPQVLVYNKIDLIDLGAKDAAEADGDRAPIGMPPRLDSIDGGKTSRAWVSAATGAGLDGLRAAIEQRLGAERIRADLHVPSSSGRLRARLHAQGLVAEENAEESGWHIRIDAPRALVEPLFGLPDGDGDWLRRRLLAAPETPTYNRV
jgi:GTP-binding protein HflX